ncbi:M23 family metallopeptidase [Alsobacter sp. SYSU M60028]|uniref:M23 family metallopeptidase n=1 Tax=Alsobacter ponti TaxID=2962936 RepID=A0ABT1LHW3_9HYPH|nr:M23 family metallopeptidase [Alsobacter ponti]MCP8940280.1 M23 family metallopeptidase [Alsobacter ponti]
MPIPRTSFPQLSLPVTIVVEGGGTARRWTAPAGLWALAAALVVVAGLFGVSTVSRTLAGAGAALAEGDEGQRQREQISTLRAALDDLSSRRIVDRGRWDAALDELRERQIRLENRQTQLSELLDPTGKQASARPAPPSPSESASPAPEAASSFLPLGEPIPLPAWGRIKPQPRASLDAHPSRSDGQPHDGQRDLAALADAVSSLDTGLLSLLSAADRRARERALQLGDALRPLGLDPARVAALDRALPMGGPLVPVAIASEGGAFETALAQARRVSAEAEAWRRRIAALPLRRPLAGAPDWTSGFGTRIDPFTRGLAMHTGLDLRDDWGAPVRATAPGRVTAAEWSGAYGLMVEVEHAGGVATRYGHLSSASVRVGDEVAAGALLGRVGSTGRSTGPHLHYEIRLDGDPVDPQRWLRVAANLNPD